MAILSKVKSVASKAVGAVKKVASAIGGVLGGSSKANTAGVINAVPTSATPTSSGTSGSWNAPSSGGGSVLKPGALGTLNSAPAFAAPAKGSSTFPQLQSFGGSPIYSAPVTLMGGARPSSGVSGSWAPSTQDSILSESEPSSLSSPSISASALSSPVASISAPSAPTYSNPGQINNGGLISTLADGYNYDPATNSFGPIVQATDEDKLAKERNSLQEALFKMTPQKENVFESPEVKAQNDVVRKQQQEVANYTSQLNSVVAQQNVDLLRLRGIGSQEGVTETVYGGQAATINREAAIKALPIQAALAGAQGNLALAQDYLTQLTTWKTEQITNEYNYKVALFNSISEHVKGEQKIKLDALNKKNDRAYELVKANIALQDSLMKTAIEKGVPGLINSINSVNPNSPNFRTEIGRVAGSIATQVASDNNVGGYTSKQLTALSKLNEDVSKNATYAKTTAMRGYVDNVTASLSQGTGVGDLAAINQFQKVIDEGAVTRDQDVKLIQSSQSLVNSLKTKVKKLENGEQLSPELRQQMRVAVESLYEAQVAALANDPYIKAKTKQAELYGLTAADTIIGELGAFGGSQQNTQQATPKGKMNDKQFVETALTQQGINYNEIVNATPAGYMPVVDNATGQAGHIPVGEFNPAKYTRL